MRVRMRSTSAPKCASEYGRRIAASISSDACCSGRWKCGASRGDAATRSTSSGLQSIGSSELSRNSTSAGHSASSRASASKRAAVAEVAPVGAEMHAGQRDLAVTRGRRAFDGGADLRQRLRAPGAARARNDAVAAALVAAGLHAQRQRGAARHAGFERRAAGSLARAKPVRRRQATGLGELRRQRFLPCDSAPRAPRSAMTPRRPARAWRSSRSRRSAPRGSRGRRAGSPAARPGLRRR